MNLPGGHLVHRIPSSDAGMVSAFPVTIIPQEQGFTRCLYNLDFDEVPGLVRKRPGVNNAPFDALGAKVKGLGLLVAGGPFYIAAHGSTVVRAQEGGSWSEISPAGWDSAAGIRADMVSMGGRIIVTDGVNQPFMWDGNDGTTTTLTAMPKGKYLSEHRSRVMTAGMTDDPLILRVAHPGDPTSWDPAEEGRRAFSVYAGDDKPVNGLIAMDDFTIIGKDRSLYALVGTTTSDFAVFPIDRRIGIGSHWASKFVNGRAYFPDQHGNIYQLEPGTIPTRISAPLKDFIDKVNPARVKYESTATIMRNDQYIVTLPIDNDEFVTFVYDTVRGRWRQWDTHLLQAVEATDFHATYFTTTEKDSELCKFQSGRLRDYANGAIDAYMETLELHMGAPKVEKEINNLWVGLWLPDHESHTDVYARTDMGDWKKIGPGFSVEGNENDYQQVRIPIHALGRNVQFRLANDVLNQDLRLLDLLVTFLPKELE